MWQAGLYLWTMAIVSCKLKPGGVVGEGKEEGVEAEGWEDSDAEITGHA